MQSTRRSFLATATAAPAILRSAQNQRPNVLFIAIDDLNDWIGCLGGNPDTRTPNMDRLAGRGVLFSNAHCAAPLCNPSRAALMTGIRPSTSGVYLNPQPWRQAPLLKNAVTLSQHFMANGYTAIGTGKIYHDSYADPASWDEYWPSKTKPRPGDPMPDNRPLNGIPNTAHFDWGPLDVSDADMGDTKVVDWAAQQLGKRKDKPLFLACGIFRPHLPWYVPRKYFDLFPRDKLTLPQVKEDDLDDVPPIGKRMARPEGDHRKVMERKQWRHAVQAYLASIAYTDAMVGRLLDAFDASPYAKDTAVVLWSDHGWHLGEKLHWRKFSLWEEATRNVFTMSVPGVTKPKGRCMRPVNLLDIYPTLAEACGLPKRDGVEGVSLMPLLKNPSAAWDRPTLTTYQRGNHSVRSEHWRYTRYNDGTEELYDHRKDPMEWTNLASKPEWKEVKEQLGKWMPTTDAPESPFEKGGRGVE